MAAKGKKIYFYFRIVCHHKEFPAVQVWCSIELKQSSESSPRCARLSSVGLGWWDGVIHIPGYSYISIENSTTNLDLARDRQIRRKPRNHKNRIMGWTGIEVILLLSLFLYSHMNNSDRMPPSTISLFTSNNCVVCVGGNVCVCVLGTVRVRRNFYRLLVLGIMSN